MYLQGRSLGEGGEGMKIFYGNFYKKFHWKPSPWPWGIFRHRPVKLKTWKETSESLLIQETFQASTISERVRVRVDHIFKNLDRVERTNDI